MTTSRSVFARSPCCCVTFDTEVALVPCSSCAGTCLQSWPPASSLQLRALQTGAFSADLLSRGRGSFSFPPSGRLARLLVSRWPRAEVKNVYKISDATRQEYQEEASGVFFLEASSCPPPRRESVSVSLKASAQDCYGILLFPVYDKWYLSVHFWCVQGPDR